MAPEMSANWACFGLVRRLQFNLVMNFLTNVVPPLVVALTAAACGGAGEHHTSTNKNQWITSDLTTLRGS